MKLELGPIPIDVARDLVEETLILASRNAESELQLAFREEMEAVQSIETVDIRETRFEALDSQWMERFRVADPLATVLAHHPGVQDLVSMCFLKRARAKEDEMAFLHADESAVAGSDADKPALVVQLLPETLLAFDKLEALLRTTLARARRPS